MKLFSAAIVVALFCAVTVSAAPSSFDDEIISSLDDQAIHAAGITDYVTKILNSLIEKNKCVLDLVEDIIGESDDEGDLKNIFKKFRADVTSILKNDTKQCFQTKGLIAKLKCTLTLAQKINTLNNNFYNQVLKANTDVAKKIYKALIQCAKKKVISNEQSELPSFADGISDGFTKILNALLEKAKCVLDVIEKLVDEVGNGELKNLYTKFRADLESLYNNDVKQCAQKESLIEKTKCILTVAQKGNTLFSDFVSAVTKIDKDLATKVIKAIEQCAKESA